MATLSNATNIKFRDFAGGKVNKSWTALSGGNSDIAAGYGYTASTYWVAEIQFTTATAASYVEVQLLTASTGSAAYQGKVTLRYILLDAEDSKYNTATGSLAGDGTATISKTEYGLTVLKITKRIGSGTHYLYLWSDTVGSVDYASFHMNNSVSSGSTYIKYTPAAGLPLYVNVSGTVHQAVAVYINVGGTIKTADAVFVNVNGTIKKIE